jgi:hypothetical protein
MAIRASLQRKGRVMMPASVSKPMIEARSVLQNSDREKNRNTGRILSTETSFFSSKSPEFYCS